MRTLLLILILSFSICYAQKDSLKRSKERILEFQGIKRHAISLNVGGVTGLAGFTYEHFLSPKWNVEIGGGFIGGGFGTSFYPMPIMNGKPRFHMAVRSFYYNILWGEELVRHCLSVGLTHFAENGLTFSSDVGPCYAHNFSSLKYYNESSTGFPIYVTWTLKIGYRFSVGTKK